MVYRYLNQEIGIRVGNLVCPPKYSYIHKIPDLMILRILVLTGSEHKNVGKTVKQT